ncbi:hypothetical protein WN59_09505 [Salinicoccus sediminis]|uniref:Uncharacterized protein n=1 Tax=Salinicoccus sediminis TaxID=1432562 RepID=A0A0M2SMM0_9STAP|nr:hypothetical protein [Salinicoccus sediminis]KKK33840.1 hypothetical protein WN59_09505 [Salinicoccus sediminis]
MDKVNFRMKKRNLLTAAVALTLFMPQNDALATTEVPSEENTSQEFTSENNGSSQNPSTEEAPAESVPDAASVEEAPSDGGQPSSELPAGEGEGYPEASGEVPEEEAYPAGTEVASPYINSVSVSGQSFEPGDLVTVTIEGTSGSVLNGATATFQRTSGSDTAAIDISSFNITDHGNGYFTATATYQLPDDLGNASYSLTGVTLADQAGGYNTISNADMNFGTGFEVVSPVPEDITPPNLISMYTDKEVYAPGDTVTVTVEGGDESEIDQMWGAFSDVNGGSENGTYRLDNIYITQNPLGNYVGVGTFTISEDAPEATYDLNFVGISDVHGNEGYFNQYDYGVSFDIVNGEGAEKNEPELVDITSDKTAYKAGEAAVIEVTAADDSEIIGVTADFVAEGDADGQVYSTELSAIEQDEDGNYVASTEVQLPEKLAGETIKLTDITIVDVNENVGKYSSEDTPELSFDVTEAENVPGDGVADPDEADAADGDASEEDTSEEIAADDETKGGFLSSSGIFSENVILPAVVLLIFGLTVLFVVVPLRKRR